MSSNAVVLRGALRRKVVEDDVVETYTHDEVVRYLSFATGNRSSLRYFFWGIAGSFQRRNGEWVSVDVFAGRNCGDRWLLVKIKGRGEIPPRLRRQYIRYSLPRPSAWLAIPVPSSVQPPLASSHYVDASAGGQPGNEKRGPSGTPFFSPDVPGGAGRGIAPGGILAEGAARIAAPSAGRFKRGFAPLPPRGRGGLLQAHGSKNILPNYEVWAVKVVAVSFPAVAGSKFLVLKLAVAFPSFNYHGV